MIILTKEEKIQNIRDINRRKCEKCESKNAELLGATIVCYDCNYKNCLFDDIFKQSYPKW